ncbi:MAG: radical SAM protein [Patescibacteria group bacterium]|nr:radical SAM protein [Patescibacteria group bacterium]MDE2437985.1 radical SAM protein [Patescibacteria group bacterium]
MSSFTTEQELKLYLLAHGIRIEAEAEEEWMKRFGGPMSLSEYASTSGICLFTTSGIYINAPFIEAFTKTTEARFVFDGEFAIVRRDTRIPVSVIPVPAYHHIMYRDGGKEFPYTKIGVTHTDRCRISPIEGCAWVCTFCDLPYEKRYGKNPKHELLRAIELAKSDSLSPARHVLISGGTPRPEDEPWIDDIYAFIAQNSPIPVDVMMPARHEMDYPAWLRSVGVNMLSINIEIWDPDRAQRITPNKARQLGREHYLNYIEEAVKAFGIGFVQSLMVFGEAIEPIESTLDGVRALVERGCIPVLSPFRPDFTTPMSKKQPATIGEMQKVYFETVRICNKSGTGLKPGPRCMPCHHNTVVFPDKSGFYVPLGGDLTNRSWNNK